MDSQSITQAESQLHHASVDSSRIEGLLLEQIDSFEKRKVLDLKAALKEYVNIELAFHAKALEVLTEAYQSVQGTIIFLNHSTSMLNTVYDAQYLFPRDGTLWLCFSLQIFSIF